MSSLISKFGSRWVIDGPEGRFHARTKRDGLILLNEAMRRTGTESCRRCAVFVAYGSLNTDLLCPACSERA